MVGITGKKIGEYYSILNTPKVLVDRRDADDFSL